MSALIRERLLAARVAVTTAARIAQSIHLSLRSDDCVTKPDQSPVTVADYAVQAAIALLLRKGLPREPLQMVAEEDTSLIERPEGAALLSEVTSAVNTHCSDTLGETVTPEAVLEAIRGCDHRGGSSGSFWVLDPIDGTTGFIRGGQYAIGLGFVSEGATQLGVVGCPNLPLRGLEKASPDEPGTLFFGSCGGRAFFSSLEVPEAAQELRAPASFPLKYMESFEASHTRHDVVVSVASELGITESIQMDSMVKYLLVARGDAALYLRIAKDPTYQEHIWDHCAASVLLEEAGGTVTDLYGERLNFGLGKDLLANRGIIATGRFDHSRVVEASRRVLRF